jgi:hypothetical protein
LPATYGGHAHPLIFPLRQSGDPEIGRHQPRASLVISRQHRPFVGYGPRAAFREPTTEVLPCRGPWAYNESSEENLRRHPGGNR